MISVHIVGIHVINANDNLTEADVRAHLATTDRPIVAEHQRRRAESVRGRGSREGLMMTDWWWCE
jgi:hypothetical protein